MSYQIESRLGTRAQFAAMVAACHDAGVRVIADAVVNHMAGIESLTGWAGTEFTHYEYPGLYTAADFHHCTATASGDIEDYRDPDQVQDCELVNLADLDTSSEHVRAVLRAYLADLVSLGVDGFRIDAAKHMAPEDVGAIISELPDWPTFKELGTTALYAPSELAVPFVTNHDTERNGTTMSYRDGAEYQLATALMILHGYGSPMVYSGFSWSDRDQGPLLDGDGAVRDAACIEGWSPSVDGEYVCAHTWPMVRAAVAFAAVAGDEPIANFAGEKDVAVFSRGEAFAVVNRGEEAASGSWQTGLPGGKYCDLVVDHDCAAPLTVVDDGTLAGEVPALGAVIITAGHRP